MHRPSLTQIDLNLLHTMRVFVDCGGVAAAARALGRSQPAISARLHRLESDLGVQLFERRGRRLRLTPAGRAVDRDARDLLGTIQRIVDRARAGGEQPAGAVRIGVLPTVGVHVVAPILASFSVEHPEVHTELVHGLDDGSGRSLLDGQLDLLVSVGRPPSDRGLWVRELARVRPVLALAAALGAGVPSPCSPTDVAGLPFFGFGRVGDAFFDAVWRFVEEQDAPWEVRVIVPHIQTLKALVAEGAGFSILPDYTVVEAGLESRPMIGLDFSQPLWIAARSSSLEIPVIAALLAAHEPLAQRGNGPTRAVRTRLF